MTLVIQRIQEKGKHSPVTMIWKNDIVTSFMTTIQSYLSEQIDVEITGLAVSPYELKFWVFDTHVKIIHYDLIPDWDCPQDIARKIVQFEQLISERLDEMYPEIYISITL